MDYKANRVVMMHNKESKQRVEGIRKHYEENIDYARELQNKKPATTFYKILRDKEFRITMSYLAGEIRHGESQRVLDIGCNTGRFIKALLDKGVQGVGVDIARMPLTYAKQYASDGDYFQANIINLPFKKESFDIIICIELFSHLPDDILNGGIEEIARVIKKGGILIFNIKNKSNFIIDYIYRKNDSIELTLKARTVKELSAIVESKGFEVVAKKGIFFPILLLAPYVICCCIKE
jgi:SAM-dependent methyltransferase